MGILSKNRAVLSSLSHDWATPATLFRELDREFRFTLDVCASRENAKCRRYFTKAKNGLARKWAPARCWMNPPYGKDLKLWMKKAYEEHLLGALVVCLVPARTDTYWWRDCALKADEIRFLRGRIRFGNGTGRATFPSVVIVFQPSVGHTGAEPLKE